MSQIYSGQLKSFSSRRVSFTHLSQTARGWQPALEDFLAPSSPDSACCAAGWCNLLSPDEMDPCLWGLAVLCGMGLAARGWGHEWPRCWL